VSAKYAFIAGEEGNYPDLQDVRLGEGVPRGFYEWRDRAPSATAVRRERLAALVRFAFEHSDGTFGYRRIHAQLRRWGHYFDDETIRSVMRELGLVTCQPRPFRPTTTIAGDAETVPDLVRRSAVTCVNWEDLSSPNRSKNPLRVSLFRPGAAHTNRPVS
jgi:putative transposase